MPFVIEYLRHLRDVDLDDRDVGSLLVYDGQKWVPLVAGEDGEALVVASGEPGWGPLDTSVLADVDLDGKALGTLLVPSNGGWVVLPIGADGQQLTADSQESLGLKWVEPAVQSLDDLTDVDLTGYAVARLLVPDGGGWVLLPAPTEDGYGLLSDASEPLGLRWGQVVQEDPDFPVGHGWTVIHMSQPFAVDEVSFDVPEGFSHLRIEWLILSELGTELRVRFNDDNSLIYDSVWEENGVADDEQNADAGLVGLVSEESSGDVVVPFYMDPPATRVRWESERVVTGDLKRATGRSRWDDTTAVSKVTLLLDAGEFDFGSRIMAEVRGTMTQTFLLTTGDGDALTTGDGDILVFGG